MKYVWRSTNAPLQTRYDDIWFLDPQIGWAVNSAGQIIYTDDGGSTWTIQQTVGPDVWLRCIAFSSATDGWVGTITRRQRLWRTQDGQTWSDVSAKLPPLPTAICGICAPSKQVIFAAGTQYPAREAAILHSADGGETWQSLPMGAHANLLIDIYFTDDQHGWVVGGRGGTTYDRLKPVVLHTTDGGRSWEDRLEKSNINFPRGEWGWKIQFLNAKLGFVSLENDYAAAILKTVDGGLTWARIEVVDPQRNVNLEGIGFLDEMVGWVGGWGAGFPSNPLGTTSATTDGGATWKDANEVGRFINRFRFTGAEPIVGYAAGGTVYQCNAISKEAITSSFGAGVPAMQYIPFAWEQMEIKLEIPDNTKHLAVTIFDPRQTLVKVLIDEAYPSAGPRIVVWDFVTDDGKPAGVGHFMYRVSIDHSVDTGMAVRPGRASPENLAHLVIAMIRRYSALAKRSHDELVLPGSDGETVSLKSLFDRPVALLDALIRGGWIVPGAPDRSMLLVALIQAGPMQSELTKEDVELLSEWITAGAVIPTS